MNRLKKFLLTCMNRIGQAIPKRMRRAIADFPGALSFFEKLSQSEQVEILTPEGGRLTINPLFHSSLIHYGDLRGYEPAIRGTILEFTKPGMTAYDVGANVGVFSFLFSSIVGKDGIVYSFEPEENNYKCLETSLKRNGTENIVFDKRAVGKARSTAEFDRRGGAFSGRLIGTGQYHTTGNIKVVETISIDLVIEEESYRAPDIIKIDVEGNEAMVLEGMKDTLKKFGPIVICELHTHLGETADQAEKILTSFGYTISDIKPVAATLGTKEIQPKAPTERHIIATRSAGPAQSSA